MACFDAYPLGEACWCWRFGETISAETSRRVLGALKILRQNPPPGLRDLVPAYTSLAVHFDPLSINSEDLLFHVNTRLSTQAARLNAEPGPLHTLPTRYTGEDLASLAADKGMSVADLVRLHSAPEYLVAMIGFRPHFPYLIGLDPRLACARRDHPRARVPAGSVAIGGEQTGVYPDESPGGWLLIGQTDPGGLRPIQPGDRVRFVPEEAP